MATPKFDAQALKKKAMQAAQEAVTKKLKSLRCPVHGQQAKVTPKISGSKWEWEISACCQEMIETVKALLK